MIDHRLLQRVLFRAQMDSGFAALLLDGPASAAQAAVPRLGRDELALLRAAPRAGITADPGATRRLQVLGNATLEFRLCLALAPQPRATLEGFAASEYFHRAIDEERPLPLAAAAYLGEQLPARTWAHALWKLEAAMAQVRRMPASPPPPPGTWQRAARAPLLTLAAGTLDYAGKLQQALDAGRAAPPPPRAQPAKATEHVLLAAAPPRSRWTLAEIRPERVEGAVAALLELLEQPRDAAQLSTFAAEQGADFAALAPLLADYVAEGAVLRGA